MQHDDNAGNPYQLELAQLQWQAGDVPLASHYDDIYFSRQQGLQETEYVFLQHNHLPQRWQLLHDSKEPGAVFTIGETGFGTGLNFLAAWRLWRETAPERYRLHYISTEKHPLSRSDLQRSLAAWPQLEPLAGQLLDNYPTLVPGHHSLQFDQGKVTLHLLLGDAGDCLEQLCSDLSSDLSSDLGSDRAPNPEKRWQVDAWFLDGFAPAKNPSLWNDRLYQLIARLSDVGTTIATFTAVGEVRRGLGRSGFAMHKVKGFGSKRDMLRGSFEGSVGLPATTANTPWFHNPAVANVPGHVAVIGGGLAGCHSARALAARGIRVTLIDAAPQLADGASGNSQGMLYTKLSPQPGLLNRFTLASYLYALRHYRKLERESGISNTRFCGVLQLACNDKDRKLLAELQSLFRQLPELVQFLDPQQASRQAGIALQHPGWFYPGAGWAVPPALCRQLTQHPLIEIRLERTVAQLRQTGNGGWEVLENNGACIVEADAAIVANSRDALHFEQCRELPLKTIRGQVTRIAASPHSTPLQTVICHEGYLTPALDGHHHLGATFDLNDSDTALRPADHRRNLDSLKQVVPDLWQEDIDCEALEGRAGLRCASPDYLPLVGPVAKRQQFLEDYAPLRKNARSTITTPGSYYPGLYLNIAHGSRGLTSTPLCAELLAALINREPPPLQSDLQQALNPARFIIRDLIRNKI